MKLSETPKQSLHHWIISVGRKLVQPKPQLQKMPNFVTAFIKINLAATSVHCLLFCPFVLRVQRIWVYPFYFMDSSWDNSKTPDTPFFSSDWRCSFHLSPGCCLYICSLALSVAQWCCSRCQTHISPCLKRLLSAHFWLLKILWLQPCVSLSTSRANLCSKSTQPTLAPETGVCTAIFKAASWNQGDW